MTNKRKSNLIRFAAVCGNVYFIYSIIYHSITDRFASTMIQLLGYAMLVGLLAVNTLLLTKSAGKAASSDQFNLKQ